MIKIPARTIFIPVEHKPVVSYTTLPEGYSKTKKFFHPNCKIYQRNYNYLYYCYKCNEYITGLPLINSINTFKGYESIKGRKGYTSCCLKCKTEIDFFGLGFIA